LAQQEDRPAGDLRAPVQAPRRGEVEYSRAAPHFQENGREFAQPRGLFRDPQRVGKLADIGDEKIAGREAAKGEETRRIGETRFRESLAGADPQHGPPGMPLPDETGHAQREAGRGAGVAGVRAVDFGERGLGQAAAESGVETLCSRPERCGKPRLHRKAGLAQDHAAGRGRGGVDLEALRQGPFDLRDGPAQGQNGFPRHGGSRHVGLLCDMFLLCSYGFQRLPQESSTLIENLFLALAVRFHRPAASPWENADRTPLRRSISYFGSIYATPSDSTGCKMLKRLESHGLKGYIPPKGQRMARIYQTRAWHDQLSPSIEEIEILALEAYAHLPEEFRKLTGEIVIQIAEFPTDEIMDDLSLETPFDLLGLFEGRGIAERWNPQTGEGPNRVTLYRRAILDYWAENEETLGTIVTHVLIHEIGHHFGLSDDDMERIEEEADETATSPT
jgi:predicted Zn-dependent protease with MMP-like domain